MRRFIPYLFVATSFLAAAGSKTASMPLYFEPNQGQADPRVAFIARGNGLTSYLTSREAVLSVQGSPVRMRLIGAASTRKPEAVDRLPGISSYFRGNDSSKWRTGIPQFGTVRYHDVYPGVDVVYYGNQGNLEYDFQIAPGADPAKIRIAYEGARNLRIEANGDLILTTQTGDVRQKSPMVYQELNGKRTQIAAAYRLLGRKTVTLALADYDRTKRLIVDPVLQYATYFGGPGSDGGEGVKVDAAGNVYIFATLAYPQSDSNPFSSSASGSGQEVAVIKFSPSQNAILLVAHVGTTGMNYLDSWAIDTTGAMYLGGRSVVDDIPLVNPIISQGTTSTAFFALSPFLTKIAADGKTLVYSTYFTGSSGGDAIYGIATDASGDAYIAGVANSSDFPVLRALYSPGNMNNGFLAEISPSGSLTFSTVYPMVNAFCVALDGAGGVYIAGAASPNVFPTINSIQPAGPLADTLAGAVKFSADGQTVIYSTMFGGNDLGNAGGSEVRSAAADSQGNLYVAILTESPDFPLVNPIQNHPGGGEDVVVAEINPTGNALLFSTYLGGDADDTPYGIALDSAGTIYVTGSTVSSDFPVLNSAPTSIPKAGGSNLLYGFVSAFAPGGQSLLYSTLIGGSVEDFALGVATDAVGNVYIAGETESPDFPVTSGAYQKTIGGQWDAFLMILGPAASSAIPTITATPQLVSFVSTVALGSPPPQTVTLTAPAGTVISTSVSTVSGGNWLSATLTGTSLSVSANSSGLAAADYDGQIQVTGGTATLNIGVILHVIPPPAVLVSYSPDPFPLFPTTVTPTPTLTPLTVTGTGFVRGASAHVYLGGAGLPTSYLIESSQVTVVNSNTVQFLPDVAATIPLTFAVTVTNPYAAESNPLTIQVGNPAPQISAVQNAASGAQGGSPQPVSPGEIITITGVDFGSPIGVVAPASYTAPIMQLGNTQVFFDGVAAPVTYVAANQINAVVPYSLSGKTTTSLTVQYLGVASAPTMLAVVPSMTGVFTANASGTGQASILNQDGSTNSSSNPAARGSTVTLFATGLGATNPQIANGVVPQNTSIQPALPVSLLIGGQPANVVSSYAAPGMLGVFAINAQIPSSAQVGTAVTVVLLVGAVTSQQGTTIATQ